MPRGAKGWPIITHEGPRRVDAFWAFTIFGIGFPTVFAVWGLFVESKMPPAHMALMVYALFNAMTLLLVVLLFAVGGRLRWTPTTVLWIPNFGRRRHIDFDEVIRARTGQRRCAFETAKWQLFVPTIGGPTGRNTAEVRKQRDQVNGWLDQCFAPITRPAREEWKIVLVNIIAIFIATPLAAISIFPASLRWVTPLLQRRLNSLPDWKGGVIAGGVMVVMLASTAVLPMMVFVVAKYGLGIKPQARQKWRLRREKWQGFEVEPVTTVASPPSSL